MPTARRTTERIAAWRGRFFPEPPPAAVVLFLVFVVAKYMQWGARREIFAKMRVEFLLGLLMTVVCAYLLADERMRPRGGRQVLAGIGLLFVAMLVQIPFAADGEAARVVFVDRVIKFAMLTFFIAVLVHSPRLLYWFMAAFIFACFYVTQEAARGAFSGSLLWQNQGVMRLHGAVPIYAHPNSLGGVAMGLVPFCILMMPAIRRWRYRLLLLPPLATATVCILYSGSRTAYVAFIAFLFFWWTQSRRKGRWLLWAALAAVVAIPAIPSEYVGRFMSIGGQEAEGHSKAMRMEILSDSVAIFMAHPTGVGVASFPKVRRETFGRTQDTHNLYLEVATNLGVQGLAVFLFLVYAILAAFDRTRRRLQAQAPPLRRALARTDLPAPLRREIVRHLGDLRLLDAVALATAGFVWVRLALGMFGMDLYEVYWWFASGLAISLVHLAGRMGKYTRALLSRCETALPAGS